MIISNDKKTGKAWLMPSPDEKSNRNKKTVAFSLIKKRCLRHQ
jgi:hypothetical protein